MKNFKVNTRNKSKMFINDEAFEAYLNDIKKYPILSKEEERELLLTFRDTTDENEREAVKNKLITSNLRFVVSIAKKISTKEHFLDAVSEGNIGLINAIEKFDFSKNCNLISYAVNWIIAYINTYHIKKAKAVVPPNPIRLHNYVRRVVNDYIKENEHEPTKQEVADLVKDRYNFNITNLEDIDLSRVISVDEKYNNNDEEEVVITNNYSYIKRTSYNNVQEDINRDHLLHHVNYFMRKLTKKERDIVKRYYGIDCPSETLEEISDDYSVSKERIRQLCLGAVRKMQKYCEESGIKNNIKIDY